MSFKKIFHFIEVVESIVQSCSQYPIVMISGAAICRDLIVFISNTDNLHQYFFILATDLSIALNSKNQASLALCCFSFLYFINFCSDFVVFFCPIHSLGVFLLFVSGFLWWYLRSYIELSSFIIWAFKAINFLFTSASVYTSIFNFFNSFVCGAGDKT